MGSHAREGFERRAGVAAAALACLALLVRAARPAVRRALPTAVALALAIVVLGATDASAMSAKRDAELRAFSDEQLAAQVATLDAEATEIGSALLATDAQRNDIVRDRDTTRRLLAAFLAESYKQGSTSGNVLAQVLSSSSIQEAADRARVANAVSDYHGNLVRSFDTAETQLAVSAVERAQLITKLSYIQAQVVELQSEQGRRAQLRAEHAAARAERAAEAAAERQARERAATAATGGIGAPGMLVAGAGSPFIASSGPPSAASIDAYLASKGSPMTGQGGAFMASGARWQVDPRLLVAIAGAESSFGQITCGPNNAWGWACPNDPADFATWAHGIDTVTEGLRRYYLDEGRTSVSLIQQKYCPVGAANDPTGLNNHWTTNVTKFLLEQGGNPAMVGPGPSGAGALQLPDFGLLAAD